MLQTKTGQERNIKKLNIMICVKEILYNKTSFPNAVVFPKSGGGVSLNVKGVEVFMSVLDIVLA